MPVCIKGFCATADIASLRSALRDLYKYIGKCARTQIANIAETKRRCDESFGTTVTYICEPESSKTQLLHHSRYSVVPSVSITFGHEPTACLASSCSTRKKVLTSVITASIHDVRVPTCPYCMLRGPLLQVTRHSPFWN